MGRRVTGEGTIYRRKDGRYEVAIYSPTTSGKRKRIRVYAGNRAEADQKLTELKRRVAQGVPAPDKNWKLGEYLDYWLEEVVKVNRRPTTYAQCEMVARLYLKPAIGRTLLTALSVTTVQHVVNQMLADGFSIPKVQVVRKVLSSALTSAMREDLVSRNAARLVALPTYEAARAMPWTVDEAQAFLRAAKGHTWYAAFVLLLFYGLRRGEVLGLRWCDLDLEHGAVHVRQQVQRAGDHLEVAPLKTAASKRDLPMLRVVQQVLNERREHAMVFTSADTGVLEAQLVFAADNGRPLEASVLVRSFQRLCQRHGIRPIRVHDIRHTTATLLKHLRVPVRDVQLILGHARITTTQEIYEHDTAEERRESLELVEAALVGKIESVPQGPEERPEAPACSRQRSRQNRVSGVLVTELTGAGNGTLTHGLILGKSIEAHLADRLASVNLYMHVRLNAWKVGVVAVNRSRQIPVYPKISVICRSGSVEASQMHARTAFPISHRPSASSGPR